MNLRKRNMTNIEFQEWFESKLITVPGGCKEWSGCRFLNGYGVVRMNGKNMKAHRVSFELYVQRPISDNMFILHSCNNPPCCNPSHLREGTHQDNMTDKLQSGRQPRGEANAKSKLTQCQVDEIRKNPSNLTQYQLADLYGVKRPCIAKIQRGKIWRLHDVNV